VGAFGVTGIDLTGPLFLKIKEVDRLFTCAVYRAVHLELVEESLSDGRLPPGLHEILQKEEETSNNLHRQCTEFCWGMVFFFFFLED
jgi:hypothetical protein